MINDSNSKVYGADLLYGDANKNKGGMAESIMTTFSKDKVILDNNHIYIEEEEEKTNKDKEEEADDKNLKGLN